LANIVELRNITKRFSNLTANDNISINIKRGTIHSIIGENGAGKSTLMNILSGLIQPDEGEIIIDGKKCAFLNAKDANKAGIGMVHQEFMLYPELSVVENIILGYEKIKNSMFLDLEKAKDKIVDIESRYSFQFPLDAKIKTLPISIQQQVEIAKVLYRGTEVIILDEPTAVLTPQGIEGLFKAMKFLVNQGKTILFITHKMKEVMEISDQITVLKNGKVTGTVAPHEVDEHKLASMMVGREVFLNIPKPEKEISNVVLNVEKLRVKGDDGLEKVKNASFFVRKGEVFGIAGVANNGQKELIEAIFGLRPSQSGKVKYKDHDITNTNPSQKRKLGIGYIPQDRINIGSNVKGPLWENAIMGYHLTHMTDNKVFLSHKDAYDYTNTVVSKFNVKIPSIFSPARTLSGGNLQKLVVGREFNQDYDFFLIEDPTRGIDIGSTEFIWKQIVDSAAKGKTVLLISHDLNEILTLSDRIGVIFGGRIVKILDAGSTDEQELGYLMTGGND
jgi:ABC-type uncharacterized transport system ATPase subunit